MFEVKMSNSALLKRIFEAIKEMVQDVNLECTPEGLALQAMDNSHVALVALRLGEKGFLHYRCDKPRSLGLNMAGVNKVFKMCGPNDSVTLQADENSDSLTFIFEAQGEERISQFSLKLMTIDAEALGLPEDAAWDVAVALPSKDYLACSKNLSEFSDTVSIEVDKNGLKFKTSGDVGAGEIVLKSRDSPDGDIGVDIKVNQPVKQQFAIKYMNLFGKAANLSDTCRIQMSNDHPIEVKFEIKDKIESGDIEQFGEMKFYLAPKMPEDSAME